MTEQDEHNYSSSPHRLTTYSASDALQDFSSTPIATGIGSLDMNLQGKDVEDSHDTSSGGISRGELTEIYGPPGVGKTSLALQIAVNELKQGRSVIWVDTLSHPAISRLKNIFDASNAGNRGSQTPQPSEWDHLHHFYTPTLPHLLALLAHPSELFPPADASLIVIDSVSSLFALAFPKRSEDAADQAAQKKRDSTQWASGRRFAVMNDLVSKLGRLAITRNIAIIFLSQTTTKVRSDSGAYLHPAISSAGWDSIVGNRLILFRDWLEQAKDAVSSERLSNVRFAGLLRAKGVNYQGTGKLAAFTISRGGLHEVKLDKSKIKHPLSPPSIPAKSKRKRDEIADSESGAEDVASDDDYGWEAEDETLQPEGGAEA